MLERIPTQHSPHRPDQRIEHESSFDDLFDAYDLREQLKGWNEGYFTQAARAVVSESGLLSDVVPSGQLIVLVRERLSALHTTAQHRADALLEDVVSDEAIQSQWHMLMDRHDTDTPISLDDARSYAAEQLKPFFNRFKHVCDERQCAADITDLTAQQVAWELVGIDPDSTIGDKDAWVHLIATLSSIPGPYTPQLKAYQQDPSGRTAVALIRRYTSFASSLAHADSPTRTLEIDITTRDVQRLKDTATQIEVLCEQRGLTRSPDDTPSDQHQEADTAPVLTDTPGERAAAHARTAHLGGRPQTSQRRETDRTPDTPTDPLRGLSAESPLRHSYERARELFGEGFFGIQEVEQAFTVLPDSAHGISGDEVREALDTALAGRASEQEQPIRLVRLSPQEIQRALSALHEKMEEPDVQEFLSRVERGELDPDNFIVRMSIPTFADNSPITLQSLEARLQPDMTARGQGRLLYDTNWYVDQPFYTTDQFSTGIRWDIITRTIIPKSTGKTFDQQTQRLAAYAREIGLDPRHISRREPVQVVYDHLISLRTHNRRLLINCYDRTGKVLASGGVVGVGYGGAVGLLVNYWPPSNVFDRLGVVLSR